MASVFVHRCAHTVRCCVRTKGLDGTVPGLERERGASTLIDTHMCTYIVFAHQCMLCTHSHTCITSNTCIHAYTDQHTLKHIPQMSTQAHTHLYIKSFQ